jgi:hypothetical protein
MRHYAACLKNATCFLVAKAHKLISKRMLTLAVARLKMFTPTSFSLFGE